MNLERQVTPVAMRPRHRMEPHEGGLPFHSMAGLARFADQSLLVSRDDLISARLIDLPSRCLELVHDGQS